MERGDRVAVVLPSTPETAAVFLGTWKPGRSSSRCRCSTATRASRTGCATPQPKVLVTDADNAVRIDGGPVDDVIVLDREAARRGRPGDFETVDTAADDPAQLYYTSGTTGLAKGILHAHRYLLAHEEFIYCHDVQDGELFHGMGEWAWAAGIAPLLGPWRFGRGPVRLRARGRLRPRRSSSRCSPRTRSRTCSRRRRRCGR